MSLPITGQQNWGVPLDDYINNVVLATANQALSSITTHAAALDPHGDRAYAASLVAPITSGVNLPNGYLKLDPSGQIPSNLLPVGAAQSNIYDAKRDFGAVGNGTTDDSAALQLCLDTCTGAGGGEVWLSDGVYAIGTQLVIGAGTWLHLSPGATIKRIIPVGGSAPSVMLSNVSFSSGSGTPSSGNILISGGKWDAVGSGLTSNCIPILLVQAKFAEIEQVFFTGVAGQPLIELNGATYITTRDCVFTGTSLSAGGGIVPAVRLNSTSLSTTLSGMSPSVYNNSVCSNILVESCTLVNSGAHSSTNRFLGADLFAASFNHTIVTITGCSTAGSSTDAYPPVDFTHVVQGLAFGNLWNVAANSPVLDLTTTGSVFIGPSAAGGAAPNVYVAGKVSYAAGYPGNVVPEVWHTMSLQNSFSAGVDINNATYPPAYKLLPDGSLALRGVVSIPSGGSPTGTTIATLPNGYVPSGGGNVPTAIVANTNGNNTGFIYVRPNGNLQFSGGLLNNNSVNIDCVLRIS